MSKPPSVSFMIDDEALYEALNTYRQSLGITWKRAMLISFAEKIANNGDNPDLAIKIVNHLTIRKKHV